MSCEVGDWRAWKNTGGSDGELHRPLNPQTGRDQVGQRQRVVGSCLCGGRIDHLRHFRNPIGWEPALFRVFPDHLFIWRKVDAVDLVAGHVALDPLDLWPELPQDPAGFLGDALELIPGELSGTRDFAFNDVSGHVFRGWVWEGPSPLYVGT